MIRFAKVLLCMMPLLGILSGAGWAQTYIYVPSAGIATLGDAIAAAPTDSRRIVVLVAVTYSGTEGSPVRILPNMTIESDVATGTGQAHLLDRR